MKIIMTCVLAIGSLAVLRENGGHGLMFQYPDEFSEKVIGFLRW